MLYLRSFFVNNCPIMCRLPSRGLYRKLTSQITWVELVILFCSPCLFAGQVRSLDISDRSMKPIYLKMGQSTVLRFNDRPQKIVIGNQNYFNIEFIGNDVTIQPQGLVTTNLFIYGKYHTYGFILRVSKGRNYDDLVKVRWRPETIRYFNTDGLNGTNKIGRANRTDRIKRINKIDRTGRVNKVGQKKGSQSSDELFVNPGLRFNLKNEIEAIVVKVMKLNLEGFYLMDIELKNISSRILKTSEFDVSLTRGGKKLNKFEFAFESDEVPINRSRRCRIIFQLKPIKNFTLHLGYKENVKKVIIKRRFL